MSHRIFLAACAAVIGCAGAAQAATLNFDAADFVDQEGDPVGTAFSASVTDAGTDTVSFDVSLDAGSVDTGDILMIGLSIDGALTSAVFSNVISNTNDTITQICHNTTSCGGGGGFNGGLFNNYTFDAVVRIGTQGSNNGLNTAVSFDISQAGLDADAFEAVGLRIQSVGSGINGGGGSLQIINQNGTPPPPFGPPPSISTVPLPAAGGMLLAGLLGMLGLRRRQRI